MPTSLHLPFRLLPALALGLFLAWALPLCGQTLYWDVNGNTAGAVTSGNSPHGTWSTGAANWNTSSTGTGGTVSNWTNTSGGLDAIFSAGTNATSTYTVTVSGTVDAGSITIEDGTPTFSGGVIRLEKTSPDFTVGAGLTATVNSVLGDWYYSGLTKLGTGTLVLGGNNTFEGITTVSAGTLTLANSGALGLSTSGNVIASGATLALQGGITVNEGSFTVSGTGSGSAGAIRNNSGNNTLGGQINLQNNTTVVSNGGTLTFSGQVGVGASNYTLTTSGAGNVTYSGNVNGTGSLAQSGSGNVTFNGDANLNTGSIAQSGSGTTVFNSAVNASGAITNSSTGNLTFNGGANLAGNITNSGTGTLTFAGTSGNSIAGTLNIDSGTVALAKTAGTIAIASTAINVGDGVGSAGSAVLRLDASNQIADYAGPITVKLDGNFNVNGYTEGVKALSVTGTGQVNLGGGNLTVGVSGGGTSAIGGTVNVGGGSLTFAGGINTVTGTVNMAGGDLNFTGGTNTINGTLNGGGADLNFSGGTNSLGGTLSGLANLSQSGGTLTLLSNIVLSGELEMSGGTVFLNGRNVTAGTLHVSGNSTIDFAGGNSTLNFTNLIIDAGVTLTVANWANAADYFYTQGWTGATFDTSGTAPMNQIVFSGVTGNTQWQSFDKQVTPVPEPSTYGLLMLLGAGGFVAWRRRRRA